MAPVRLRGPECCPVRTLAGAIGATRLDRGQRCRDPDDLLRGHRPSKAHAAPSLPAPDRPGRPGRDPARAGGPGAAPGWDPGGGHDHHPRARRLPELPRLRGRTRTPGSQPPGPHHLAAPGIILLGRPAVSGHPRRGAGDPGRSHPDPPGTDRILRLPVLRSAATRRSRRAVRQLLHPPRTRLGTADLTASLPRSARAWTGNGTPREPRGLKHRPEGTTRTVPIPPQLARLLRWHLQTFGCAADGRLFQGARGGPLSESLYGRIWHQARTAAIPGGGTDRCPAGAPPPRSAPCRAVAVAGLRPGWDQIASQHIEQALRPSRWPSAGPRNPRGHREFRPLCVRATAGPSGTRRDLKPPPRSG
jgi:hypothetical protein